VVPIEFDALREAVAQADEPGLVAAWLFGSRARGDARADSDADIALLYSTPPAATLEALPEAVASAVEGALHADADVVVLNTVSPDLIHRVLRDGVLLMDRDPAQRIRFEVRARNEYFDLLPTLRRYRRQSATAPHPTQPPRAGGADGRS
jgi:predicted nucleotidyltransferase